MSDSKLSTERIGFSTGALERGNIRAALDWLQKQHIPNVELSALRLEELEPLVKDLDSLPVEKFSYVSFHAPSSFPVEAEAKVVDLLEKVSKRGWNIVAHPDVIRKPALWQRFGSLLLVENMDRRKAVGRTANELDAIFKNLPEARLCLDVAHARQLDTTLTLLVQIVKHFAHRIAEIHISELDSRCRHQPMSSGAVTDYQSLAKDLSSSLPVIIESMLDGSRASLRMDELNLARLAVEPNGETSKSRKGHTPPTEKRFKLMLGSLVIGMLQVDKGEWVFAYSDEFRKQSEIKPIVDFPVIDREYRSRTLWPFFALRIPSSEQPAVREFIHSHPNEKVDEGILLKEFGERSIANPFRLVPV